METKVCKKCDLEKPIDQFAYNRVKSTNGTLHIYKKSSCKRCDNDVKKSNYVSTIPDHEELDGELWKQLPEFNGLYEVSNFGRVRSISRTIVKCDGRSNTIKSKILNQFLRGTTLRYYSVFIQTDWSKKGKHRNVHILVAKAFVPNPYNLPQVNHLDSDPLNNNFKNLEWADNKNNQIHSVLAGRRKHLSQRVLISDINNNPIIIMGSIKKASQVTGTDRSVIRKICLGKCKQSKGKFKFSFLPAYD